MKTALIILCEGFEEVEALTPVDILRRGDVDCTLAALHDNKFVIGKTGIQVVADEMFESVVGKEFDLLVIPGGPGVRHLRKNKMLLEFIKKHAAAKKLTAAICAGPTVLKDAGILQRRKYTAHFSVAEELPRIVSDQPVVQAGHIITSQGAGTALAFSLYLLRAMNGKKAAEDVRKSICAPENVA